MRIVGEVVLWVIGIAVWVGIARGLSPVSGIARAALSPIGIGAILVLVVLFRWRSQSTRRSRSPS